MIKYAQLIENLCKDSKELNENIKEVVEVYRKCYSLTKDITHLNKAKELAINLLKYYPDNSEYWILLSRLHKDRHSLLLQAVTLDPENEIGWSELAFYYYSCGSIEKCIKCLIELKGLNPLNKQLHLCQALIYYSLWTQSKNLPQLELAWGHIGEYLEGESATVLGWALKGLLTVERKNYEEGYLYLQNVMKFCEKHEFNDWKWIEYKYIESAIKSNKLKDLSLLLSKLPLHSKFRNKVKEVMKELNNEDYTYEEITTIKALKRLNALIAKDLVNLKKIKKCSKEVLESVAKNFNSRASRFFLYFQLKAGIQHNDKEHCKLCIKLIADSPKSLFKNLKMNKKAIEHLLTAELGNTEQQLKLTYISQPELYPKLSKLFKDEEETLQKIKVEYLKYPNNESLHKKLIMLLVQSGSKKNVLSALKLLENNEELKDIRRIAQQIKEAYCSAEVKQDTDNELGILLTLLNIISEGKLKASGEDNTEELIRNHFGKEHAKEDMMKVLVKTVFLLHAFGYCESALQMGSALLNVADDIYNEEAAKGASNKTCKELMRNTKLLIAILTTSLLRHDSNTKAKETVESLGFLIAEDSVAINLLYIQATRDNIFKNKISTRAFKIIERSQINREEAFMVHFYSMLQYVQLEKVDDFSLFLERVQQMLNQFKAKAQERYGNLSSSRAIVNALHGMYMLKMVVFLEQEKEKYVKEGYNTKLIEKKMEECSRISSNQLKVAIKMNPEFAETLKTYLNKVKAIH